MLMTSVFCSLFCLLFFLVYDQFSHGVRSPFMTFLFIWPLALCVIPCGILLLIPPLPGPSLISSLLWNTGAAAVTVSSLLRGVFEIAGNSSVYQQVLVFEIAGNSSVYQQVLMNAGGFLLAAGLVMYSAGVIALYKLHHSSHG